MSSVQPIPPAAAFPQLSQLENDVFEALAAGCTAPAAIAARLNLPVKAVLLTLSTPAFLEAARFLDAVAAQLDRHTTRFRQQAGFQALEQALAHALEAKNPAVACRIAIQLLRPAPPLPDHELEHAERDERLTRSRRTASRDAALLATGASHPAAAAAEVTDPTGSTPRPRPRETFPSHTIESILAHRPAAAVAIPAASAGPSTPRPPSPAPAAAPARSSLNAIPAIPRAAHAPAQPRAA